MYSSFSRSNMLGKQKCIYLKMFIISFVIEMYPQIEITLLFTSTHFLLSIIFTVYVFFGSRADLIQFSTMLQMRKLLATGEYVIIYIDFEAYSEAESYIYFWSK